MIASEKLQLELEDLLLQRPAEVISGARAAMDARMRGKEDRFVLFGSGELGRFALGGLRKAGISPLAFADNNANLWGKSVEGIPVLSPQDAVEKYRDSAAFVVTVYTGEPVKKQLRGLGVEPVSFPSFAFRYSDGLLPRCSLDLPGKAFEQRDAVLRCLDLWADDRSREEYVSQLRWRTFPEKSSLPDPSPTSEMYFPPDLLAPRTDEVFVDCGAFTGDSLGAFLKFCNNSFREFVAIEADSRNCQRLRDYVATLPPDVAKKITPCNIAVGATRGTVDLSETGTAASSIGAGSSSVECVPLDELCSDRKVTFIKMDIEGAEMQALVGGQNIIAQATPVLAICLYHREEDIWKIPLYIQSLSPNYRLFLRRCGNDCWETICYAIPVERVLA